jgi:hypothetical protein
VAFQTGLPSVAPGKLKKREDMALLGTPKEKTLFVPQDDYYPKLAKQCVEVRFCLSSCHVCRPCCVLHANEILRPVAT